MVERVGSSRRKTRKLYSVPKKLKGKLSVSSFVRKFELGSNVILNANPTILKGMYFKRFHAHTGKIVGMQGRCYKIKVKDNGKEKMVIVAPIHLKKA